MSDVLNRIRGEETRLYLPDGSEYDPAIRGVQRAVEEYDERLVLARHEITGDWVVFIKLERNSPLSTDQGNLYPVVGLGPELPDVEEVRKRLYQADARRHGSKLLDQINDHNDRLRQERRAAADEAIGETAEALEWGFRKEGWHPQTRIFVPRGI